MSRRDPSEPFWLAITITNADDTIFDDLHEGVEGAFDTEGEAVECLKDILREHGGEGFVYRCVPVSETRRQPRVKPLKTRFLLADGAREAASTTDGKAGLG